MYSVCGKRKSVLIAATSLHLLKTAGMIQPESLFAYCVVSDAFERITNENIRRHRNNTNQPKCSYCQSFVSLEGDGKKRTYVCKVCGKGGLRWLEEPKIEA